VAAVLGVAFGIAVTRPAGRPLQLVADLFAAASQAVPPVVVVALAFPSLGFGAAPTALALVLYCVMPVLRGTVGGLQAVSTDAKEVARAMGMTPSQILWQVELPIATPAIVAATRVALVLAVATAAVGALAGAATLGTPIVLGLQNQNELYILQGAAATAALAFLLEGLFILLAHFTRIGFAPQLLLPTPS
jgi:osmoprotectant transport system permease protein